MNLRRAKRALPLNTDMTARFEGFSNDGFRFYRELHRDNSKAFWEANKHRYLASVRAPLEALAAELEGAFGEWHVFRPYRDLRFSKDKRPYKERAALQFGGRGPGAVGGQYLQIGAEGLFLAVGTYYLHDEPLKRYRRAVADDRLGSELEEIVAELVAKGHALAGESLKRAPQGFTEDHPRIELLRRKGLVATQHHPPEEWMYGPEAVDRVARFFADGERLSYWFRARLG